MPAVGLRFLAAALIAAAAIAQTRPACAQSSSVPRCSGGSPDLARRARADALRHYRNATRGSTFNAAEMNAALRSFDDACANGDDSALEFRAYALAGLGRYVEAAESLDAYVRAHPLESLPSDVRDRVNAQRGQILAQVATLDVTSPVAGALVSVNGRTVGAVPINDLRVAPGRTTIEVSATGYRAVRRDVDLVAGSTRVEAVTLEAGSGGPGGGGSDTGGGGGLPPLVIAAGAGAVVFLGGGVGAAIWRSNRADTYNSVCFMPGAVGCDAVLSEYNTAGTLEIVGFVGGGLLAAGAIVGAVLHYAGNHGGEPAQARLPVCAPDLAHPGVQCAVAF